MSLVVFHRVASVKGKARKGEGNKEADERLVDRLQQKPERRKHDPGVQRGRPWFVNGKRAHYIQKLMEGILYVIDGLPASFVKSLEKVRV